MTGAPEPRDHARIARPGIRAMTGALLGQATSGVDVIPWNEAARQVAAQVVRIETHDSWGTGFFIYGEPEAGVLTIGTAYHVIENTGKKPVHVKVADGRTLVVNDRAPGMIYARLGDLDAVVIICTGLDDIPVPTVPLLDKRESLLSVGVELGWLGYPQVAPGRLCFFSGKISAIIDEDHFFVDGTAIHGVSGGPAFCITADGPKIVGSITAYLPNWVVEKDTTLPGLSLVTSATAMSAIGIKAISSGQIRLKHRE